MIVTAILTASTIMGKKYMKNNESASTNFKNVLAVLFNIAVSISIVLTNKWVYSVVNFPNMTLTFLHFVSTFLCLHLCQLMGFFSVKHVPLKSMIPLACFFCGFVVLTNLSLENNSVGTYQVAKVMTTPCVLFIQFYFYGKLTTRGTILTVIPIIFGVMLTFIYDLKFNIVGSVYALFGVVVTSFYQVMIGEKQKELQLNSMQLLYYQAPISAALLILPVLICEPISLVIYRTWTFYELLPVVCSCLIAFAVNLSIYWIIGNTSALTYNMAGHSKFVLTVTAGYLLFHDPLTSNQLVGLVLTLTGVIAYTHLRS